ncbi:MAG: hypothetical protein GC192_10115 [Bacteroidetes bacterium]|nr:hypothetical protein [Bacteroidota bacterium]
MKKILWIFSSSLLLSAAIFTTGCGDDSTTVNDLAPVVSLTDGPNPASVTEGTDTYVTVTVNAIKGTKALKYVYVYESGVKVSIDDFNVNGKLADANPNQLANVTDAMDLDIDIKVTATEGVVDYTVKVEDEGGLSDEVSFTVNVTAPATPLDATITGATIQLWNAGGPAGKGGIDLDNGASTGTKLSSGGDDSYLMAELRDMGIDSQAVSTATNWRRRLGGINGTQVRFVGNTSGSTDFGAVASKEAIEAMFDGGTDFVPANSTIDGHLVVWGTFLVSDIVQEGDVFAVYKSSTNTYYLVKIDTITQTDNDNNDNYKVTIKY